jgi:hypothetical protein
MAHHLHYDAIGDAGGQQQLVEIAVQPLKAVPQVTQISSQ